MNDSTQTPISRADSSTDFGGLRVVTFESRKANETAKLIRKSGGIAISAPSMKEVPLGDNPAAKQFAEALADDAFDVVIFLTGVGAGYLFDAMGEGQPSAATKEALSHTIVVARGPKPVRVLREHGIPITIAIGEPNTWREIIAALQESPEGTDIEGCRIAIQEYGAANDALIETLRELGAEVTPVPVYRWALPDDRRPLIAALEQILARTADVVLFTSATQVRHVLEVACELGIEDKLRAAFRELVVASIGPICTEALVETGIPVDLEPEHSKLGILVRDAAARAAEILEPKRRAIREARAPARPHKGEAPAPADGFESTPFMLACRRKPVPYTPVWLMRQAGRYMQEYREVRARVPFIELCKRPALAAEVTVTAAERINADAAIIFSDILLIVEPMGLGLEYTRGEGPSITGVVRDSSDVDRVREVDPDETLAFVFDAIRETRRSLSPHTPLIGFSGAPFTLASYIIEGGGSRNYVETKKLMYRDEGAWNELMAKIARAVGRYLKAQVDAGCQALQLFDSWVGCLSPSDFERYVLPHTRTVLDALPADVPTIQFGTDTATLLELQAQAGGSVLGVDHRMSIGAAFDRFPNLAIQGNLDPVLLFADRERIRENCRRILDEVGGRPGHVFNLGHGILPGTPVDNVIALVDAVHEMSSRT